MLSIRHLTHRIEGRVLFDDASAEIPDGWRVGFVGRNGSGKSTLLKLIQASETDRDGAIRLKRGARMGWVAQEVEPSERPLLEEVLALDPERAALKAELQAAPDAARIAAIHERLAALGAYADEARGADILTGLGFSQADLARPCSHFSGGWRMRAALAGALFSEPDLLLLDEPTNYLDLEGAAWLEARLKRYPHTLLIVSHDRDMLNRSVDHILALEALKLRVETGGYDDYLKKRAERLAQAEAMKTKQDRERAHIQSFIDRFRYKASKARQAQSRIKSLERMQAVAIPVSERAPPFDFPEVEPLASPIFELDTAELGYEAGRPVLSKVFLRVDQDDRVAIIGANGQGKSTLVKSIAGRLALMGGERRAHRQIRIGYFSQDQLDELSEDETALDHVRAAEPDLPEAKVRALAAAIGMDRARAETRAGDLSGGEKVRLLLGLQALRKPHILILDEPTSHLDIDSREALILALNAYEGAVLLITHDVYLAEGCADRLWLVKDGRARPYDGDLDDYRALVLAADKDRSALEPDAPASAKPKPAPKRSDSEIRRATADLRKRVSAAERAMAAAETEIAEIDQALARPAAFKDDPVKAVDLARARDAAVKALQAAEADWLEASEALDAAMA